MESHPNSGSAAAGGNPVSTSDLPAADRIVASMTLPRSTDNEPAVSADPFDPWGLVKALSRAFGLAAAGVGRSPSVTSVVISVHAPAVRRKNRTPSAAARGPGRKGCATA